jgi:UDP-N-acetylglucosamine acyltransferase
MARVHPSAVVAPGAVLAGSVEVGPGAVVGEHVEVGEHTVIGPNVVLDGHTRIGAHNRIHAFCSLGGPPQDMKYGGEPTRLEIGDHNVIRECCTFNTGTVQDAGVTRVGSHNWIMAYAHIAHDCAVGDHTIFANSAQIAGHVSVGDWAILGGMTGVHQFCRVGAHSIVGAGSIVLQDVAPYLMVGGNPTRAHGINVEGLRRRGFSPRSVGALKRAYRTVFRSGLRLEEALPKLEADVAEHPEVRLLAEFLARPGRGLVR